MNLSYDDNTTEEVHITIKFLSIQIYNLNFKKIKFALV